MLEGRGVEGRCRRARRAVRWGAKPSPALSRRDALASVRLAHRASPTQSVKLAEKVRHTQYTRCAPGACGKAGNVLPASAVKGANSTHGQGTLTVCG